MRTCTKWDGDATDREDGKRRIGLLVRNRVKLAMRITTSNHELRLGVVLAEANLTTAATSMPSSEKRGGIRTGQDFSQLGDR
jgi:hypothetical protein